MTVRIAHFSDIHFTLSPLAQSWNLLMGKRLAGSLNYYFGGRGRHFAGIDHRIKLLLDDVDAQQPDHALCTGDLTAVSFREEFEGCAALFDTRLHQPNRYTVIPGNHDRYTQDAVAEQLFERSFSSLSGTFPFTKRAAPGVTLVLLDVARPTSFLDSSGLVGERQLKAARELLTDASLKDEFVILGLHYGLLRSQGERDKPDHRIRDDEALLALVDSEDVHLDLILHGHMHRPFTVKTRKRQIVCTGSATDLHMKCGYNVYDIDVEKRSFTTTRRSWDVVTGRYSG